jgi:hypothetical protein
LPFENTQIILFDPNKMYPDYPKKINNIVEIFPLLENDRETNKD